MKQKLDIIEIINKSMFFTGAGFSFGTGCLTSGEMYKEIKKIISSDSEEPFDRTEKEALKFLISCLQYHSEWRSMELSGEMEFTPNIEELALLIRRIKNRENIVPYPVTGNWADKLVLLESQFKNENEAERKTLFESLYDKLKKLLHLQWLNIDKSLCYLSPIQELAAENAASDLMFDFFSLNNDLVIESYFQNIDQNPYRGFVGGEWRGIYKTETPDVEDERFGKINLYKLHGSIDWIRLEDNSCKEIERLKVENQEMYEQIQIDSDSNPFIHHPYIIFGQGTKTFSVEPFFSLLNHFHKSLNSEEKSYIFAIGYSFFDPYINNLLFEAAKDRTYLIIVNPYLGPNKIYQAYDEDGMQKCKPKPNQSDFFKCEYPSDKSKSDLIDYLKLIQKNPFYSELPEFNNTVIRAENIEYIPLETDLFLKEFLSNNGQLMIDFINSLHDRAEDDLPFKDE